MEEQYGNSYADFTNDAAKKESIYANSASLIPIIRKRTGSAYGSALPPLVHVRPISGITVKMISKPIRQFELQTKSIIAVWRGLY